jgi:hypothetical protein
MYSSITTERPDLAILQHRFPYLLEKMAIETLKCLQIIPNFTQLNPIQNHPPINPQNTPHTNPATQMLSWNCGTYNMATHLYRNGSNGAKNIKNNRRNMYCTTHPNAHTPNKETRRLPPQKTPEVMEKRNINIPHH